MCFPPRRAAPAGPAGADDDGKLYRVVLFRGFAHTRLFTRAIVFTWRQPARRAFGTETSRIVNNAVSEPSESFQPRFDRVRNRRAMSTNTNSRCSGYKKWKNTLCTSFARYSRVHPKSKLDEITGIWNVVAFRNARSLRSALPREEDFRDDNRIRFNANTHTSESPIRSVIACRARAVFRLYRNRTRYTGCVFSELSPPFPPFLSAPARNSRTISLRTASARAHDIERGRERERISRNAKSDGEKRAIIVDPFSPGTITCARGQTRWLESSQIPRPVSIPTTGRSVKVGSS